ncbi:hypothetical protein MBGDN05_00681 [Thermoplasmatales archaeon SCGC AB-539-N05]|nr:hypothetical protein MBGDN05_00681 [Thermoplasmatales archaeon SCGC AB-539-N05]
MTYKKGLIKARILQIISYSSFPVTVGYLHYTLGYPLSTIKDTVKRLEVDRCVERCSFRSEGIYPIPYRVGSAGKSPIYFYVFREPEGERKLSYFKKVGLIKP